MIMKRLHSLLEQYYRVRFAILFFSLLFCIGAAPILRNLDMRSQSALIIVFLSLNLLAALISVAGKRVFHLLVGMTVLTFAALGLRAVFSFEPLLPAGDGLWILLSLLAAVVILRHVLTARAVNADVIFAALSVYVLFGVICGVIYFLFEQIWPGSLLASSAAGPGAEGLRLQQTLYFSFVTLGTLGYGDIVPVSDEARSLAIIETLCGQAYLTFLVAWLVSMFSASKARPPKNARSA